MVTRRTFLGTIALAAGAPALAALDFRLRYLLSSAMYGTGKLEDIVREVKKTGSTHIDLWPKKHGDQREQMDVMGHDAFAALIEKHGVKLGCLTRYDLGPFGLAEEFKVAQRFGCSVIMTGGKGPKGLKGDTLKAAVRKFAEEMKPHCELAQKHGVTIAIENHGSGLMESPDSIRWLVELAPSTALGIAFAPYHLPQDEPLLAALLRDCGKHLAVFIAWQHGNGCMKPMPKEEELLQMPGRGPLNFAPLLAALREINFQGWTNIFMHPTPRGIPIVEGGTAAVTAEINRARDYLDRTLAKA
jgi:sugar phosphate isomerase/epimerase